jgi:glycosyltransferase involved in cell wall biosynthesis
LPAAALGIARGLQHSGALVELAGTRTSADRLEYLERDFAALPRYLAARSFPVRFGNSTALVDWLQQNVKRFQIVDIHGMWAFPGWHAARVCASLGVPYVIHPHGALDPFDLRKKALLKRVLGPLWIAPMLARARAILLTAPLEAERLVTYGATVRRSIVPLPVVLPSKLGDRAAFRQRHQIPADALVVVFLSRVDYKKGLDFLIPALGRLKADFPKLWFVLAGSGTPEFVDRVRGWLAEHRVANFTREIGFASGSDKWDALAGADVFALPSLNENFGIVNIEAMHAGLPVLISDEVYLHPQITAAGAGLVCTPDRHSVEAVLRQLLDGSVDRLTLGRAGQTLVQKRYQVTAATDELLAIYRDVSGTPG